MNNMKQILYTIGILIALVALIVFMFTASSTLFTVLSGIGAVAVIFIHDDYTKIIEQRKAEREHGQYISNKSLRLFEKMKTDYKANHPTDKFFDP
mgnify:CR=1 FL=1